MQRRDGMGWMVWHPSYNSTAGEILHKLLQTTFATGYVGHKSQYIRYILCIQYGKIKVKARKMGNSRIWNPMKTQNTQNTLQNSELTRMVSKRNTHFKWCLCYTKSGICTYNSHRITNKMIYKIHPKVVIKESRNVGIPGSTITKTHSQRESINQTDTR